MKKTSIYFYTIYLILFISSCQSIPKGAVAVQPFDLDQYLGTWYELARIDFKFEEGLNNTTANYSLLPNGNVRVLNQGYNLEKEKWTSAKGKAKFRDSSDKAELKVSFFGPFYAGYNVIAMADDYDYALVAGKDTDFLWILSRTTKIPEQVKKDFLLKAQEIGYDTSRLIWIEHNTNE